MFSLIRLNSHLYFYEKPIKNSNIESIKLLVKSSNEHHDPSIFLLSIVSIYEFGKDINNIIRELNKIGTISLKLKRKIYDIIKSNQLFETSILKEKYNQYRDIDFIFDFDFFFSDFSQGINFLENGIKIKEESSKKKSYKKHQFRFL